MDALALILETLGTTEELWASFLVLEIMSAESDEPPFVTPGVIDFEEEMDPASIPVSETVEPLPSTLEVVVFH